MNDIFSAADILLPDFGKTDAKKWSVIACDQFTGDPAYWEKTDRLSAKKPSTLNLILPELYLEEPDVQARIERIQTTMQDYLDSGIFKEYKNAMIYVERIQSNGVLRTGVIGKIDLEAVQLRAGEHLACPRNGGNGAGAHPPAYARPRQGEAGAPAHHDPDRRSGRNRHRNLLGEKTADAGAL